MRVELRNRLIVGPLLAGTVIGSLVWDFNSGQHLGWLLVMLACVFFGSRELQQLSKLVAGPVQIAPMIAAGWAMLLATWAVHDPWVEAKAPKLVAHLQALPYGVLALALGMVWTVLMQMRRRAYELFFTNVALTTFGMIYMGITCTLLLSIAMLQGTAGYYDVADLGPPDTVINSVRGNQLLLLLITSCKLGDVTAYFGGHAFGRHKMTPRISPGKTWEGFAFSFVGSIGGAYLVHAIFNAVGPFPPFNAWWQPAVWGLILGPLGVVGDLAESCMKRQASVKDSGHTLPGFGGWLDVFDAVILAAPVAVVLAQFL
jgi:CDP-diglyceride synthetase